MRLQTTFISLLVCCSCSSKDQDADSQGPLDTHIPQFETWAGEFSGIPDAIDFGEVPVGYESRATFTAINVGTDQASLDDWWLLDFEQPFSLEGGDVVLYPGHEEALTFIFTPERPGTYDTTLVLAVTENDRLAYYIQLDGSAFEL